MKPASDATRPIDQQTILITGSTAGLGLEVARALHDRGATVLVHGRAPGRLERALAGIGGVEGERMHGFIADFSGLEHVRLLAADVNREFDRLDVLVNNAGIAETGGSRRESADGFELTFAVNYLSHFLLTLELLQLLRSSAPSRIVNVASIGQAPLDFDDPMLEREYDGFRAYAQSKLAQISFTFELAERLRTAGERGVTVNALHPATLMDTQMVRRSFGRSLSSVHEGMKATVRLVTDPGLASVSGRYYDGLEESTANPQAYAPDARGRLWELSERATGASSRDLERRDR
jgi:NAD(P)-dependent dehydrogenase (short-subunit alcohol dehydrogenase family)